MISQFFIVAEHGDTLTFRDFRGDVARGTPEIFYRKVKTKNKNETLPYFFIEGTHFLFVYQNSLYFVMTSLENISPTFVYELINKFISMFRDYCGSLNEEIVRLNFVLIYELLDELIDFGYPQSLSIESLKYHIHQKPIVPRRTQSMLTKIANITIFSNEDSVGAGSGTFGSPLQAPTVSSGNNEVYVDIHEKLTVLISATGHVLRSEISGVITARCFLPDSSFVTFSLNEGLLIRDVDTRSPSKETVILDSCSLHESVQIDDFEKRRYIVFTPTGGEISIMKYQLNSSFDLPLKLHTTIDDKSSDVEIRVKLTCNLPPSNKLMSLKLILQLPNITTAVKSRSTSGSNTVEYNNKSKEVNWCLKSLPGKCEENMTLNVELPKINDIIKKQIGPIKLKFECPMFICSGLCVKNLKVIDPNLTYSAKRWIRYITYIDSYIVRL